MTRLLAALLSLLLTAYPAAAAVVTITVVDGGGVSRTFNVTTPTSITGALSWNNVICDQAAGAVCASVGTAGAPSTNALTIQAVTLGHGTAAAAMRVELPTDGTGVVGLAAGTTVAVTQSTAASLNATVVGTGTFVTQSTVTGNVASGSPLAGNPVRIGISDGTNVQNWLAAIALVDGVNGNNTGAVAPWVWNGTSYDRMPGTAANGIKAIVTNAGTFATQSTVTQATSSSLKAQVDPLTAASWGIGTSTQNSTVATNGQLALGQFNTTPTTITSTNMSPLQLDANGNLLVNIKAGAGSGGTALADNSAFTQSTTSETPMGCLFITSYVAATTGRSTIPQCDSTGHLLTVVTNTNANGRATAANSSPVVSVAAASTAGAIVPNNTTAVVVKGSAGTLFGLQLYGVGSVPVYVKIYNAATATCGSGTPVKRLMIPAAATAANGAGSNVSFGPGLAMGTGITYCVTAGIADNDTTAPTATTFLVNADYE